MSKKKKGSVPVAPPKTDLVRKTGNGNTREAKSRTGIVMISDPALL